MVWIDSPCSFLLPLVASFITQRRSILCDSIPLLCQHGQRRRRRGRRAAVIKKPKDHPQVQLVGDTPGRWTDATTECASDG